MDEKQLLELSPGFRFNPTEEQLVKYYLKRKLLGKPVSALLIPEVDVYKFVPWDLPQMAGWKDQSMLYFFCPRTRKYNRVLRWCNDFGFWKTTGKDRSVRCNNDVVGKKKTLVFYRGRVPPGERTDWVMYEYRIDEKELDSCKAAPDWLVLCGIFKKNGPVWKTDMPWDGKSWKMEDISNDDMLSQDVLTTEGYLMPPTSAFLENLSVSCQAESMPSSSNITSEILDMDISSLVNSAGAVTGETLPQEFMGEDIYCFPSWSLDRDTSDLFPFEDLLPGGPSECKDKKPSEYLDIWGPENFRSTDLWQKVRDNIKYLIYLHRGYRGTVSFRSTDRWQKVRDNIQKLIYLNRGYRGPAVYQQAKDSSLQELYSEAFSWFTTVCDPVLLVDSGIYASTGPEKTLVNCRTSDSATADDEFSLLDYSSGRLSSQYLRKLVNLLLLLTPSRTLTPNLRAECFVEVYLPGSHNVLLQDLVNLKHLDLSYSSFIKMPNLSRACKLQNLDLRGCNNLVDASSIQTLTKLEYINLKGCASLMSLPSLMALKILCSLDVSDCTNLRRLPPSLGCLSSLTTLDLSNCKRIQNLPKGILRLKSLQTLSISGCSMLMEHASRVPTSTFVNTNNGKGMFIEHWEKPRVHSSLHTSGAEAKGPRLVWTPQLHKRFVDVVAHLGIMNAVPKTIMQLMNVEGLTRDYVASHLQKYRLYLRRMQGRVGGIEPPPGNGNGDANGSKDSNNSNNYSKRSEDAAKPSSTAQDLERIPVHHHPATSPSRPICDKSQHREVLKGYMSMPVEAIHQANAFHDVQRTVDYEQSSDSHESESLHDLLYCLEELQENVPATMARMHVARVSKASFESTLAQLGSSFVRTEEQCSLLAARFLVITDQEEELDAEIERLLAKRQELID